MAGVFVNNKLLKTVNMQKLIITGNNLTVNDVVNVARHGQKVELHPDARKRINECRAMLEKR